MPTRKICENVKHYLIHLNYAGFELDKLFLQMLCLFGSLAGSKTTESTDRVLSSVNRDDRLHIEFRITSQRTVSSFCYPTIVVLRWFLENYARHFHVSFILALHGSFSF